MLVPSVAGTRSAKYSDIAAVDDPYEGTDEETDANER
jgi:hypothetical protein